MDVVDRLHLQDAVGALTEAGQPPGYVVERLSVVLPRGNRGVDRGHAALVEALVYRVAVPVAHVQPVDHDGVVVQPQRALRDLVHGVLRRVSMECEGVYQRPRAGSNGAAYEAGVCV